jgi:hypothetical protein
LFYIFYFLNYFRIEYNALKKPDFDDWRLPMGKREKRTLLFCKLGFISSILAAGAGLAALVMMLQRWQFQDNLIVMTGKLRPPLIMAGLFFAVVLGFLGFLGSLEGAANGQGKIKSLGWLGFAIGAISTMMGIILGMCFHFYRM